MFSVLQFFWLLLVRLPGNIRLPFNTTLIFLVVLTKIMTSDLFQVRPQGELLSDACFRCFYSGMVIIVQSHVIWNS